MGFLKKLLFLVAVVGGLLWVWGRSLPREHEVASRVTIVASGDSVWQAVRNIGTQPSWWSTVRRVKRVPDQPKETWEQDLGFSGVIWLEVTRVEAGRRLITTILDPDPAKPLGWGGSWTITLRPDAAATEVTVVETGFVEQPFNRVIMRFIGQQRTVDSYLRALSDKFGTPGSPKRIDPPTR